MRKLYYGDNLLILHEHIADESVELNYFDPPLNSKRDLNMPLKAPKGVSSTRRSPPSMTPGRGQAGAEPVPKTHESREHAY